MRWGSEEAVDAMLGGSAVSCWFNMFHVDTLGRPVFQLNGVKPYQQAESFFRERAMCALSWLPVVGHELLPESIAHLGA